MSRPLRLLLTCFGTVLALAGALWLPTTKPTYEQKYRPLATGGHIGQMITTRDFRIRVRKVVLADSLLTRKSDIATERSTPRVARTDGVWVVIVADVGAEREALEASLLEGGEIHTADGATYRKNSELPAKDANDLDDPVPLGPTKTQWFYFELPRDRLTDATFEVTKDQITFIDDPSPWGEQWFLPAARVDLGLDSVARTRNALRHLAHRLPIPEGY